MFAENPQKSAAKNVKAPEHIVIFHPAAIGDSLLATPVARVLKLNFPQAKITWWAHGGLKTTLEQMCPFIDAFIDFNSKSNLLARVSLLRGLKADLFVDLSNSAKGKLIPGLSFVKSLHYRKRSSKETPIVHAVDNFLETIEPICARMPESFFPTIFPEDAQIDPARLYSNQFTEILTELETRAEQGILPVGLVPGVGKLRPNRRWPLKRWAELIELIKRDGGCLPVLIGGIEDSALSDELAERAGNLDLIDVCGKLELHETAAILRRCQAVVSGDTGPAHLAVSVGRPVIGLYGPTRIARSGPYRNEELALNRESSCQCTHVKACRFATITEGVDDLAGRCMGEIGAEDVMSKLRQVVNQVP